MTIHLPNDLESSIEAVVHKLVTGNTAHFQRIQQLGYPLTLANWRS
jgi:hypothetical protein